MRIGDWSSDVCSSDLHPVAAVAIWIELGRAVISREWSKRPDDVDQIFMLALGAIPHVMIAMGKLPRITGMDFDRLRHLSLNPVAPAAEYGLNGAEGLLLPGERFTMGRVAPKHAAPLGWASR